MISSLTIIAPYFTSKLFKNEYINFALYLALILFGYSLGYNFTGQSLLLLSFSLFNLLSVLDRKKNIQMLDYLLLIGMFFSPNAATYFVLVICYQIFIQKMGKTVFIWSAIFFIFLLGKHFIVLHELILPGLILIGSCLHLKKLKNFTGLFIIIPLVLYFMKGTIFNVDMIYFYGSCLVLLGLKHVKTLLGALIVFLHCLVLQEQINLLHGIVMSLFLFSLQLDINEGELRKKIENWDLLKNKNILLVNLFFLFVTLNNIEGIYPRIAVLICFSAAAMMLVLRNERLENSILTKLFSAVALVVLVGI